MNQPFTLLQKGALQLKNSLLALSLFTAMAVQAQTTLDLTRDSLIVTGPFTNTDDFVFLNQQTRYTNAVKSFGLQFRNGLQNDMPNNVSIRNLRDSPIIGVSGAGTEVRFRGRFESAAGQSFPSLALYNGGKLIIADSAKINLVLAGSFFTRQFWILGDGTGTLEFEEGFTADRTQLGTVAFGLGSIRLSNTQLITNHSRNVPKGYRPNPALINSHLVFENQGGSVWRVQTNDQVYEGGLWINVPFSINTVTNLTLNGRESRWSDYVNWGGVIFQGQNASMTKNGAGELIISGDHAYREGSKIILNEGITRFQSRNYDQEFIDRYNFTNVARQVGNHLLLTVNQGATLSLESSAIVAKSMTYNAGSTMTMETADTLIADTINLNGGTLTLSHTWLTPTPAVSVYKVLQAGTIVGQWDTLNLPTPQAGYAWDVDSLYITGELVLRQTTSLASSQFMPFKIGPNPISASSIGSQGIPIYLQDLPRGTALNALIVDALGRKHELNLENGGSMILPQATAGLYEVRISSGTLPHKIYGARLVVQ